MSPIPQKDLKLLIGEVSQRSGISTKAIRYYEKIGLIDPAERTSSSYRVYPPLVLDQLKVIWSAKTLGLSLGEVYQVISAWRDGRPVCHLVRSFVEQKLQGYDRKIAELSIYRDQLRSYLATVDHPQEAVPPRKIPCPHLEGLMDGVWAPTVPTPEPLLERKSRESSKGDPDQF